MHSNKYIFIYSSVMVVLVAIVLTVIAVQLKPAQENNIRVEKMKNILTAVNIEADAANAEALYKKFITEDFVINSQGDKIEKANAFQIDIALENKKSSEKRQLPVYVCTTEKGDKLFVVPMRGKGLWGPIWGYVSFRSDFNTVAGTMFDHKGETPGLGAEIDTRVFQKQFIGKKIFDETGKFVSVKAKKGGAPKDDLHGVDAISGGTITSNGLSDMLISGISVYEAYFKKQQKTE